MNCTEFDQHWQRRFDLGAGIDPAHLLAHLAQCPRCQAWQRAWETLERAIDAGSPVPRTQDTVRSHQTLADRVVAELQIRPSRVVPRRLRDNPITRSQEIGRASDRRSDLGRPVRPTYVVTACLAAVCFVWGSARFFRPSSTGTQQVALTGSAEAAPLVGIVDLSDPIQQANQPSRRVVAAEKTFPGSLAGGSGATAATATESPRANSRPPIVKPLVGMVHNLTSLILPGWPSVFNDSVGIPHYLETETAQTVTLPGTAPALQAQLALVKRTEVPWPEPVEELLAVATESVQTMWDLANQW